MGVAAMERDTGLRFGGGDHPLLVSVRSGAAVSMPGMMDTILDLGVNEEVEAALARASGDPEFARETHLRFVESYARAVFGARVVRGDEDTPATLRARTRQECGHEVPEDPLSQLRGAVEAVFASWNSRRAVAYRKHWNHGDHGGTAVTVQRMVYGNLDDLSGTGVLFTRNPHDGTPGPLGEFLVRGQGEDVVSGEVDPVDIAALATLLPEVHQELLEAGRLLERNAADVQDVEFTVERGKLFLLQTRNAKRSPVAAVRFATALVDEGLVDEREALTRVKPAHVESLLQPVVDPAAAQSAIVLAEGEPACPGVGTGLAVVDCDEAMRKAAEGEDVVLARRSTSPDDIEGMILASGICTEVGGRTSHAAVVSRELGRPAVVGCGEGLISAIAGRRVTVDGTTGRVYDGVLPLVRPDLHDYPDLARLAGWARQYPDVLEQGHPLAAGRYESDAGLRQDAVR
ncbi:MAG: pyruvate, phosphate dikinase [Nocardioides sp.]|uniref:pyruvate, phosphate dikinase n=1 Tax=Nocardioides sp. TaxID=35761 RepID=UPI0039E63B9B